MDYLELSNQIAGSGKFIELHHTGALQKAQPLWAQYCRLRKHLENVKKELSDCNDAVWLYRFADKCRSQGKDFERELLLRVDELEKSKAKLESYEAKLCSRLEEVDSSFFQVCHTLAGARLLHDYELACAAAQTLDDDIFKRRAIIAKYPRLGSSALCGHFDAENLPVPEDWTAQFPEVDSWAKAYENLVLRNRIHKMISKEKRKLRLP